LAAHKLHTEQADGKSKLDQTKSVSLSVTLHFCLNCQNNISLQRKILKEVSICQLRENITKIYGLISAAANKAIGESQKSRRKPMLP
jgi:hypothetical protein